MRNDHFLVYTGAMISIGWMVSTWAHDVPKLEQTKIELQHEERTGYFGRDRALWTLTGELQKALQKADACSR